MTEIIELPAGALPVPDEPDRGAPPGVIRAYMDERERVWKHNEPSAAGACPAWCAQDHAPGFDDVLTDNQYMYNRSHTFPCGRFTQVVQEEYRPARGTESTWGPVAVWVSVDAVEGRDLTIEEAESLAAELRAGAAKAREITQIPDALLSLDEVEQQYEIPGPTLRLWRSRGIGPRSVRIGGRVVYRRSDLDAWVAANGPGE